MGKPSQEPFLAPKRYNKGRKNCNNKTVVKREAYKGIFMGAQNMHPFLLSFLVPLNGIGTYDHFEGGKNENYYKLF